MGVLCLEFFSFCVYKKFRQYTIYKGVVCVVYILTIKRIYEGAFHIVIWKQGVVGVLFGAGRTENGKQRTVKGESPQKKEEEKIKKV